MITCTVKCVFGTGSRPGSFCNYSFDLFVSVVDAGFFSPALSLLSGHTPAHEAKCFSVGKTSISRPISAIRSSHCLTAKPRYLFKKFKYILVRRKHFFYASGQVRNNSFGLPYILADGLQHIHVMCFYKAFTSLIKRFRTGFKSFMAHTRMSSIVTCPLSMSKSISLVATAPSR